MDRFKLYWAQGNWDRKSFKWICYKLANKIFRLWYIEKVSDEKLLEIYSRTKIWFNMHLIPFKWPSNLRLYELLCNGVMELCDNVLWLQKIFKVWNEIVWYDNINDAIKKIEYYLEHDNERKKIAKAWYKKTIWNYTLEKTYKKIFDTLFDF